ncbi:MULTISPECIES: RNA helicase [unclassified Corynebacterium]|uniref:DEAD/DEAH box helicase n=1 Tax=unclassified Corynebacterium TaxID=2624378 RepID=UPI00264EEC46|nr:MULTISPECIES: DEAD/DEAH box helicase [unclassified Corynebacterium]MDN8594714.1 DEAD/DEAH box helicase [Corynebacterium sp. P4_F2]WKK56087.1 DEAD/DEAH box helicase [Corynebacterium sp. P4-C1]WKK63497.1 DEAD/DEAH box helicase [Corynebacterium sp. P8-C1]
MVGMHLDEFRARKPFPLDDFQIEACEAVEADRGVLVCAPTGSGKTVVGEFAVSLALSRGTKCFYTTPIKALSNQKYHDLVDEHGEDAVGLLTGDTSINGNAEIVVMTTEVLRNMIYAESPALDRLSHVVMDEIHYLADRDRGAVWEEIILNLDESARIIGLSATVSNSEEFGEWLDEVRGDTDVIVSEKRPVPLNQFMMVQRTIMPLFEPGTDRVNRDLERTIERLESGADEGRRDFEEGRGFRSRASGRRSGERRPQDRVRPVGRPEVVEALRGRDMLPAIVFIFSRAGCDGALFQCLRSRKELTTRDEAERIKEIADAGVEGIPEEDLEVLNYRQLRTAWSRGFAAHHAGMLPAFKHIVEQLFVEGLVRVVFATETLALGINMPARTVVLEKMVKFNGDAHVDLTPGQYTQLTGRAGRRGIDSIGNAVVQWAPAMDPRQVAGLASTRTYPLISLFTPGYNMAINMLQMNGFEDSIRLIEKSFAQFQTDRSVVGEVRKIERQKASVDKLRAELDAAVTELGFGDMNVDTDGAPDGDIAEQLVDYTRLRRDLADEEKKAKKNSIEERHKEIQKVLGRLQVGEVIALPSKRRPELAAVVAPAGRKDDPRPWITTERGWSGRIDAASFGNVPVVVGRIKVPRDVSHKPRRHTRRVVQQLSRGQFRAPKNLKEKARTRTSKSVLQLRDAIRAHPVHSWPPAERERLARLGEDLVREERALGRAQASVDTQTDTLGRMFERIIGLLTEMDYVELVDGEPTVTEEGERLARIHNVSDLLVAQCLKRGIWDELDPAELAGVASMCVFENRKATGGYPEAATDRMADAMNDTQRIYSELASDEQRHRLPPTAMPDPGFALSLHQWAAGAPLGYALAAAAESGAELTPGDFVRSCRQVIDLLEQIVQTGYSDDIKHNARRAVEAIRRGVVAIGN